MAVTDMMLAPPIAVEATSRPLARTRPDGGRLALGATAVAITTLPLLRPGGPANIAPADIPIAVALGASVLWAGRSGLRCRFPYGLAMCVFMLGGLIGALVGPVPLTGAIAVVQDIVLLLWCWVVVNVASTAERLRTLMAAWAYSAVAWAVVLFVGLAGHVTLITGQTAREGSRT